MVRNSPPDARDVPDTGIPVGIAAPMSMAERHHWHLNYLRSRPVSRRLFLGGAAAAAAIAAVGRSPFGVRAYADDAPLGVANRRVGYGSDASTQLRLSAQLSRNPKGTRVFLDHGPTADLGATVQAEIRNLVTQIPDGRGGVLAAEQFYVHAPIDGLPGAAAHHYRWRTDDGFLGDVRSASTAMPSARAATGPFRFTMIGDQGTDDTPVLPPGLAAGEYDDRYYKPDNDPDVPHTANVLRQIIAARPDFHVLAGDIAYADPSGMGKPGAFIGPGGTPPAGFDKFNPFVWDVYLGSIEGSASTTPWMFATGNHDMEAAYGTHGYGGHLARLDFPGNGPANCPSAYSFVYGNVAVLSLDANDVSYEITANTGYSGGAQTTWTARTLAAHRANPDIDFIVCFFHHCAYSTTDAHASDGGVRAAWCDLFDRYQVDLVLQGHNHVFERTDPIRGGAPTTVALDNSVVYPATDGTVYYTVGCGGRPRYGFQPGELESYRGHVLDDLSVPNSYVWNAAGGKQAEAVNWSRVRFRNYAFLRVDVRPGVLISEMDVTAVDEYGREFDTLTYRRPVRT
ncbi:metallophosphoesterase [Mycolicibacterium fluoranthenivorans]|uniref:Calcineurin-like phosphoesterase n=1 Tax=Mycolicibacterium fluoranthenivorans TaxID=258505 RepID=A0A1G4WJS9_9MYCO|nr:metallophosphoesterase [Mycolicibacterium fluoranthenivorans]SCX24201.1 Calcineurin-like phosphoesterase [Mycolicibacterium fluoranthenivorans]